jgi:hypothetical protein
VRTTDRSGREVAGAQVGDLLAENWEQLRPHFRGADAVVHLGYYRPPGGRVSGSGKGYLDERPNVDMAERVYRLALHVLSGKEQHYLGREQEGRFPDRIAALSDTILGRLERRYGVPARGADVPGRVTQLRHHLIRQKESLPPDDPGRREAEQALDDLFAVTQLYSYADDYELQPPSLEHLGEILDKFEEDVLGAPTATVRASRRATVLFGAPVEVPRVPARKEAVRALTDRLEQEVRALVKSLVISP